MFNFFKKNKDSGSEKPSVRNLQKGSTFRFDFKEWKVAEIYAYEWRDGYTAREYKVTDGQEIAYLYLEQEEDGTLFLSWHQSIALSEFPVNLEEEIRINNRPPEEITYNDITLFFEEESEGRFTEVGSGRWENFLNWDYYDDYDKFELSVELWDDNSIEVSLGKIIDELEILNIQA